MIDTSSAFSALALVDPSGAPVAETIAASGRDFDLPAEARRLVRPADLTMIAVAVGPGSFTGLRVGMAYAAGLALGRGLPVHGLGTLELAAARAREPASGLSEAGRGRVYFREPGSDEDRLGSPENLPRGLPATGRLREETAREVRGAGIRLLEEGELRSLGEAAWEMIGRGPGGGYDTLRPRYVQTFGRLGGGLLPGP